MFNKIRKKLTFLYALSFMIFLLLFITVLYFTLTKVMEYQQLEELEIYYEKQLHDIWEHEEKDEDEDGRGALSYEPNRMYFYYTYTDENQLVHGDETFVGLYKEMPGIFAEEDASEDSVHKLEWQGEHFLLLKKTIQFGDDLEGYIVLGKSITAQQHFFQKVLIVFVILICLFTLLISIFSYYLAGRAMVPIKESYDKQKKFVSDASHELRTPLSIFYSSVELIESDEENVLSTFSQELIDDLKDESQLMEELLSELLFLARHDQKQVTLKMDEIDLSSLLEKISTKFTRTLGDSVVFKSEIVSGVKFVGNGTRIEELMYILLDNAVQYTKEGCIRLQLSIVGSTVQIIVEDTGSGIHPDELALVFDRFYRGDVARKRTGTGLGLAIAKTIVEQHHGKIFVESEIGKGTVFTVELPVKG